MDVSSVSSGSNAYSNSVQQAGQPQQLQQAQQVAERRESQSQNRVEPAQEGPKPVKNAEGQTTGSVISVTA